MKKMNKWLLGGLVTSGACYGLYRIFRSEKKKVDQIYKEHEEELRDLGIDPEKEEKSSEENDGVENRKNITARVLLKIIKNIDPDGESSGFSWDSDWIDTDYYKDPDNWTYNQRSVHVIQDFNSNPDTVSILVQIPPTNLRENPITAGDYIRTVKGTLRDLIGELYPQRPEFEICGYYEDFDEEEKVRKYHKIPEIDYLKYGEGDGLSRYISKLYENDRKMLKKTPHKSADIFIRYTFPVLDDGDDCYRILKILKELFLMEVESKVGDRYEQLDTIVFHRQYLSWYYDWNKEENSFDEFEFA